MRKTWAPLNRSKGETYSSWLRRNHAAHISNWSTQKKLSGGWLPPAEYQKKTGRPGR